VAALGDLGVRRAGEPAGQFVATVAGVDDVRVRIDEARQDGPAARIDDDGVGVEAHAGVERRLGADENNAPAPGCDEGVRDGRDVRLRSPAARSGAGAGRNLAGVTDDEVAGGDYPPSPAGSIVSGTTPAGDPPTTWTCSTAWTGGSMTAWRGRPGTAHGRPGQQPPSDQRLTSLRISFAIDSSLGSRSCVTSLHPRSDLAPHRGTDRSGPSSPSVPAGVGLATTPAWRDLAPTWRNSSLAIRPERAYIDGGPILETRHAGWRWHFPREDAVAYEPLALANLVRRRLRAAPLTTLRSIAAAADVDRHTVARALKAAEGRTFRQIQVEALRNLVAQTRTAHPLGSIKAVAFDAGYRNPGSLTRRIGRIRR